MPEILHIMKNDRKRYGFTVKKYIYEERLSATAINYMAGDLKGRLYLHKNAYLGVKIQCINRCT